MHKRTLRAVLGVTGLATGLLAGMPGIASAHTETADSIPCSVAALIAAVTAADAAVGPTTITLAPKCTYTLTAVNVAGTDGSDGLPKIIKAITLAGSNTVIERSSTAPDFRIAEINGPGGHLTVTGTTVRGGSADSGGCYFVNDGGSLSLTDSPVRDCTATDGSGGGIFASGSALSLIRSPVTECSATVDGGGIYIIGADSSASRPVTGAKAMLVGGTAFISNSILASNSAEDGGAIYADSGSTVKLTIDGLTRNEAHDGGAIYSSEAGLFVGASQLTMNQAESDGGGIYNDYGSHEYIAGSSFGNNLAGDLGGAIFNNGFTLLQNSSIGANSASFGGGIFQNDGVTIALTSLIAGNIPNNCAPPGFVPGCLG